MIERILYNCFQAHGLGEQDKAKLYCKKRILANDNLNELKLMRGDRLGPSVCLTCPDFDPYELDGSIIPNVEPEDRGWLTTLY